MQIKPHVETHERERKVTTRVPVTLTEFDSRVLFHRTKTTIVPGTYEVHAPPDHHSTRV
jgi:hypothetical protein